MPWLITYSYKGESGNTLNANDVTLSETPAMWLLEMTEQFPDSNTILLFAIRISVHEHNIMSGVIV